MQAVNSAACAHAARPIFDLASLAQRLKNRTISREDARELSQSLCSSAKNILLLAIDTSDNINSGMSSEDDVLGALIASAALIELAEFAVAETEVKELAKVCHE